MTSWVTFPDGFVTETSVVQGLWALEASGYRFEPTADEERIIVHRPPADEAPLSSAVTQVRDQEALFILINFDDIVACVQHDRADRRHPAA